MRIDSSCPSPALLERLQANALPAAEAERLRQHIGRCPCCRALLGAGPATPIPERPGGARAGEPGAAAGRQYPFLAPPQAPDELGRLGGYRALRVLGEGGMGIVFEAEDPALHRRVALKVMRPELTTEPLRQRFLQEARAAASLPHDHIVTVYQVGQEADAPFLAMELLRGESLEDRLARERWLPLAEALNITRQVSEGLAVAHEGGLVHRDIKPANLWLESGGPGAPFKRVKVLDFGLARLQGSGANLTKSGQVVGTPSYMAPEQAYGLPVDGRADLYSLGCVLYRMLTGLAPHEGAAEDTLAQLEAVAAGRPRPAEELVPNLPPAVARLLRDLLARAPDDRPASARALLERLRAVGPDGTTAAPAAPVPASAVAAGRRPRAWRPAGAAAWAGGLTVLAALVVGALAGYMKFFAAGAERPEAGAEGAPIKVGALHSLTGTLRVSEQPLVDALQLAVEEINEAGGVLGRPLKLVTEDGRSREEVFAQRAHKLLVEDQVAAVFGCWTSGSRKRVGAECAAHDRLLLYSTTHEGLEEQPSVFYVGGAPNQVLLPVPRWAYAELGKRRFYLVGSESVYSRASHAILADELRRLGAVVVGQDYAPLGETDFAAVVGRIRASKADMVLNTVDGNSNLALFQALRKGGIKPAKVPTVWFNVGEHELQYLDVSRMVGDYSSASYFQSVPGQVNQEFLKRFRARYGPTRTVNDPMEASYSAVYLWKQAVEAAGSTQTATVRAALKGQQFDAPEGRIRIDPATQYAWRTARIGQVTGERQLKVVWQSPEPLRPRPFPATRTPEAWKGFLGELYAKWGERWEKHQ
jgi:urea transport system substrate-binding protein